MRSCLATSLHAAAVFADNPSLPWRDKMLINIPIRPHSWGSTIRNFNSRVRARDMVETYWRQNLYSRFRASPSDEHVQWLYTF
jgi:hypothetical protein